MVTRHVYNQFDDLCRLSALTTLRRSSSFRYNCGVEGHTARYCNVAHHPRQPPRYDRSTIPGQQSVGRVYTYPSARPEARRREAEDAIDMPDDVFRQHFSPRKETVLWLCDEVAQELEGVRSTALSVERQVLCAVRWERGDDWRDRACGQQVRTTRGGGNRPRRDPQNVGPLPEDVGGKGSRERRFSSTRGIPGVIGCVDGSLIAIIAPKGDNKAAYKVLGKSKLNSEQTETVLLDVEASEPAVTKKLEVLRLRDLSKKLRYRQKLVDQLWIQWKKKYLLELRALHIYPSQPSSVAKEQHIDPHIDSKIDVMLDMAPGPNDAIDKKPEPGYNDETGVLTERCCQFNNGLSVALEEHPQTAVGEDLFYGETACSYSEERTAPNGLPPDDQEYVVLVAALEFCPEV
ncbi:hypothetical protein HPB49_014152 [Dermacentor silvarum]|uniref:Uncharacterized protein n=1 Tax=Dermacentor silvarum TaxID=543639 RepID=A0ACB8CXT2_DERSI|nr:hypothetical protein HPB49_014152 [Dermacentor silvarum]